VRRPVDLVRARRGGVMAQSGWRLPDDLLKRVRVHCAETGERQNEFVRRALEDALSEGPPRVPTWASQAMWNTPALEKQFVEGSEPAKKPAAKKKPSAELPRIAPRHWGKS
jgi:hypothetical protein